jgi:choline-sulfatase
MKPTPQKRPNILFLMSDEHRADVTGYEGNEVIRTPTLDTLAREGVVFRNAYTPSPACVPARQCLMAGQLPKTCGCEGWFDLQPNHMTWARRFAQCGYHTVACGKLHHFNDPMQGWMQRIGGDVVVSHQHLPEFEAEFKANSRPFAAYKWSDAKEVQRAGIGDGPVRKTDRYTVQGTLDFIEQYFLSPDYDREMHWPLLLKVSLLQPHYPYLTDAEKFTYYLNRVAPYLNQDVSDHPFLSRWQVRPGVDASEREIRRATATYYGMIETVDEHFAHVLQALRHAGEDLDDWIIVYTSDHGEMLGEHGVWEKKKFYEASARVPLIIRWPKRFEPRVVEENVNLCDLFATLCDLAGLPIPEGLDSRSLAPLMQGNNCNWDNETVSQYERHVMIKRDALKYQYYGEEMPEVLFDLRHDPAESVNVVNDARYATTVAAFRRRLAELGHGPQADPNYKSAGYSSALCN